ncbi:pentapeptide repeat-containing protein [Pantoea sp. B65]|uniref:pentapeptide repeat-containing protein n=1 Tax=Pantoea sp. B65 TaxID=2813359 RepID=UPI0039B6BB6D
MHYGLNISGDTIETPLVSQTADACPQLTLLKKPLAENLNCQEEKDFYREKSAALQQLLSAHRLDAPLDLSNTDLSGMDIYDVDLSYVIFTDAKLVKVKMSNVNLHAAVLENANFNGAFLRKIDLTDAILNGASLESVTLISSTLCNARLEKTRLKWATLLFVDLSLAQLTETHLGFSQITECKVTGCDWRWTILNGAIMENIDLSRHDLSATQMTGATFKHVRMDGIILTGADMYGIKIEDCSMKGAMLYGATLTAATLKNVNLNDAEMKFAHLQWATISMSSMRNVDLSWANISEIKLTDSDLTAADCHAAAMDNINICGSNLTNTQLSSTFSLALPARWHDQAMLESWLVSHHQLHGNLLSAIDSIDINYDSIKLAGVIKLIDSLQSAAINLSAVIVPLTLFLSKPPYNSDPRLKQFIATQGNGQLPPAPQHIL